MKLRATITLLAGLALLLGAAEQPEPNSVHPRDARKIRYGQRQQLTNDKAETATSDPNTPLSLLPGGADPGQVKEVANAAPEPGELTDGVTASVSLDSEPSGSSGTISGVRSLALDGAPFGEVRKKAVTPALPAIAQPKPQVVAQGETLPSLRESGGPGAKVKADAPIKPLPTEKLVAKAPPAIADVKDLQPTAKAQVITKPKVVSPGETTIALPKSKPVDASHITASQQLAQAESPGVSTTEEDRFKLLDEYLGGEYAASNVSTDQLRAQAVEGDVAEGVELGEAEAAPILGATAIDEESLEPLGVPNEQVAIAPPGRLARGLLTAAGVLAVVLIAVVVPRPQRRRSTNEEGLTLIETIGLSDDRELVILRKKHYALVLGVTRTATHLLEKVSMASLDSDYSTAINSIIKRETESPELWRMRPLFSSSWRVECAPEERAAQARKTSLSELRASLQVVGPVKASNAAPTVRASMADLRQRGEASLSGTRRSVERTSVSRDVVIRKLREQARRAS